MTKEGDTPPAALSLFLYPITKFGAASDWPSLSLSLSLSLHVCVCVCVCECWRFADTFAELSKAAERCNGSESGFKPRMCAKSETQIISEKQYDSASAQHKSYNWQAIRVGRLAH